MSYVGDIKFFHLCRYCTRKLQAASKIVLESKVDEHIAECGPATRKRVKDARTADAAASAQGDLFFAKR